jgi:prepilin signal peptidase PulO-like enzyme (type II secretory pathway)
MVSHDLAAQSLREAELRPFAGSCPRCGSGRGWLRYRCESCSRPLTREFLVVVAGTLAAIGFYEAIGDNWVLIAYLAFLVLSLALALTDIDAMRIVNRLNIGGTALVAVALVVTALLDGSGPALGRGFLGALAYFALTNLMFLAARGRAFGYGDVKLSVQLGLFTAFISWSTLIWSVFLMARIGGVLSVAVVIDGLVGRARSRSEHPDEEPPGLRDAMRRELPYGPAMIGGAWLAIYLVGSGALPS